MVTIRERLRDFLIRVRGNLTQREQNNLDELLIAIDEEDRVSRVKEEKIKRQVQLRNISNEEVEDGIRHGINTYFFDELGIKNMRLLDHLPVAYDPDSDVWVVNDYTSPRKGHNFEVEIKIKYDPDVGEYSVNSFEYKGKDLSERAESFQKALNR